MVDKSNLEKVLSTLSKIIKWVGVVMEIY
jgi:hypothetical protein